MARVTSDPREALSARFAVALAFTSFGIVLATWAVHLPSLQAATGISTAMLGTLLLTSGVGAIAGMQVAGKLVDRYGSFRVVGWVCAAMACSVLVPLTATSLPVAFLGALLYGVCAGMPDVAMNAAAVQVERAYGRPIMASFHAMFSVGNVLGSLISAAGFALGLSVSVSVALAAALCLVFAALAAVAMRSSSTNESEDAREAPAQSADLGARRTIVLLGALAFLYLFAEGSAMDWSAVHARQHLSATPTASAVAFASMVTAMTVGRFTVDRMVRRLGSGRVVRWGAVVALVGFIVVMCSSVLTFTVVGWALVGLGVAGGLPQVFTAAGNLGTGAGKALARVAGLGYIAILAGPAVIGWSAEFSSINTALILPALAALVCAVAGTTVISNRPRAQSDCAIQPD
jgi:MFS family permease